MYQGQPTRHNTTTLELPSPKAHQRNRTKDSTPTQTQTSLPIMQKSCVGTAHMLCLLHKLVTHANKRYYVSSGSVALTKKEEHESTRLIRALLVVTRSIHCCESVGGHLESKQPTNRSSSKMAKLLHLSASPATAASFSAHRLRKQSTTTSRTSRLLAGSASFLRSMNCGVCGVMCSSVRTMGVLEDDLFHTYTECVASH